MRFVDVAARYLVAYKTKRDGTPAPQVVAGQGAVIYGHLFAQDRAFLLEAMNQAVSRLYIEDDSAEQAA